jgi:hypothetical protein
MGLALMLDLPIAAFEGLRCLCDAPLTAASGARHCGGCRRVSKIARHDTFGKRFATGVLGCLPPRGTRKVISGLPITKHGTVLGVRNHVDRDGVVQQHEVYADTTFRGLTGKSPAWEGHIDYNVCDPTAKTYVERAAERPLHAANRSYKEKERLYGTPGLLQPHQEVFIVCAELWGGLHEKTWELVKRWATEFAQDAPGRRRVVQALLRAFVMEMSLGLLAARVGATGEAAASLRSRMLRAQGVGEEEQQHVRVYDLVSRHSVLSEFAARARASRSFIRTVGNI